jgi:putative oxidoreductase
MRVAAAKSVMRAIVPIGRVLFTLIFVMSVFGDFSRATIDAAAAHGVPLATVLVPIAGIIAFIGGISVLLGYRARFGAFLLLVFLIPVTLVMHNFWSVSDPQLAMIQKVNFFKNVSLIGTTLMIMYFGPGPISLDS